MWWIRGNRKKSCEWKLISFWFKSCLLKIFNYRNFFFNFFVDVNSIEGFSMKQRERESRAFDNIFTCWKKILIPVQKFTNKSTQLKNFNIFPKKKKFRFKFIKQWLQIKWNISKDNPKENLIDLLFFFLFIFND